MLVFELIQKDLKTLTFRTLLNALSVFFLTGGNYYSETPDETWTGCLNNKTNRMLLSMKSSRLHVVRRCRAKIHA